MDCRCSSSSSGSEEPEVGCPPGTLSQSPWCPDLGVADPGASNGVGCHQPPPTPTVEQTSNECECGCVNPAVPDQRIYGVANGALDQALAMADLVRGERVAELRLAQSGGTAPTHGQVCGSGCPGFEVTPASGNLLFRLATPSAGPFDPTPALSYNSLSCESREFGFGWSGKYQQSIQRSFIFDPEEVELTKGSGTVLKYTLFSGSTYNPPPGAHNSLRRRRRRKNVRLQHRSVAQ